MLQVFYDKTTKQVIAWRGETRQGIRPIRDGEAKVMLDIRSPRGTANDYVYSEASKTLKLRPDYVAPEPPRDLAAEVDDHETRIAKLEKK